MTFDNGLISKAFQAFATDAPKHAKAWMALVQSLGQASALDPKTSELAYIAVLAALGRTSGIPNQHWIREHRERRSFPRSWLDFRQPDMWLQSRFLQH